MAKLWAGNAGSIQGVTSSKNEVSRTEAHKEPKDNEQRRKEKRRQQRQAKRKGR